MEIVSYGTLQIEKGNAKISIDRNNLESSKKVKTTKDICNFIKSFCKKNKTKINALAIIDEKTNEKLAEKIWLELDIVPYFLHSKKNAIRKIKSDFNKDHSDNAKLLPSSEVKVHEFLVSLDKIKKVTPKHYIELLERLSNVTKARKLKIGFINSTASGGGVALMRHAIIRLCKLLKLDVKWYVIEGNEEIFKITKQKIHNVLHGLYHEKFKLTPKDIRCFNKWSSDNAEKLEKQFKKLDVIIIDDPQPSGLVKYIKKANPEAKIIYRSHTQLDTRLINNKNKTQYDTWNFIHENIKDADIFASHPIKKFVPKNVDKEKVVFMPPTTDPLDGLNKKVDKESSAYYFGLFNEILEKANQKPLSPKEKYFIQVARFDPAKGIFDVLEAYRIFFKKAKRQGIKSIPSLVIAGNGAHDDPEGAMIYNQVREKLNERKYLPVREKIKVAMVPFRDQILNTIMRGSFAALQLSHREGYEVKATEALMKGKPIIIYKSGGLPLQVKKKKNGFIIRGFSPRRVAKRMLQLYKDKELYKKMSKNAAEDYDKNISTVKNLINWLYLSIKVSENNFKGNFKDINTLIKKDYGYNFKYH